MAGVPRPTSLNTAPSPHKNNDAHEAILAFLDEQYEPVTTTQVAEAAGLARTSAQQYLKNMALTGQVHALGLKRVGNREVQVWA